MFLSGIDIFWVCMLQLPSSSLIRNALWGSNQAMLTASLEASRAFCEIHKNIWVPWRGNKPGLQWWECRILAATPVVLNRWAVRQSEVCNAILRNPVHFNIGSWNRIFFFKEVAFRCILSSILKINLGLDYQRIIIVATGKRGHSNNFNFTVQEQRLMGPFILKLNFMLCLFARFIWFSLYVYMYPVKRHLFHCAVDVSCPP